MKFRYYKILKTYLFFRINIIVAFFAVIAYLSSYVPPDIFWLPAIFALSIPVMLLLNLFFIIYWFFKKSFRSILSITVLLLGIKFIKSTFIPGFDPPVPPGNSGGDNQNFSSGLMVISYNVRVFNTYARLRDENNDSPGKMIDWLADINSDILCLQEFFYDKKSDIFNSIDKISGKRKGHYYFSTALTNRIGAQFGIITFSKFPIINKGDLDFGNNTLNQATYIDVIITNSTNPDYIGAGHQINKPRLYRGGSADTIRIYNIHLQSLLIKGKDIFKYAEEKNDILSKSKNLLHLFKTVSILRSRQLDILISHINNSPYAVVVCGDLNDTPYSYTYQTLDKILNNAFEKAGNGFGFTYNSKFPFLRIDNQFASRCFTINSFKTHYEVDYSDHFPISANYKLMENGNKGIGK